MAKDQILNKKSLSDYLKHANEEWAKSKKEIEELQTRINSSPKVETYVLRVNQMDAIRLDTEINEILTSQFSRIFSFFRVFYFICLKLSFSYNFQKKSEHIEIFKPELNAFLDLLLFRFSIYAVDSTYGNKLQNLKFTNSK